MKYISMKWLQAILAVIVVLTLIVAGCGGGGGGSKSEPIKVRTLSGTILAPVAPPASLQPSIASASVSVSGSILAATGGYPVANAKVWLEGYSNVPAQYTDASGTYKFVGVTADEHFVVASFDYLGKTYKQRARAVVQSGDVDVTVPNLSLEEATQILTGVLKDAAGNVLPAGTEMRLWGEEFTVDRDGTFETPALPASVNQAELLVKLPGSSDYTSFYGPFTGGTTPAFVEQTVLLPDSGNHAPSGVLIAKNTAGIETVKCVTSEQLNFSLTPHDPDTGHREQLKYAWTASRGTLQVTGNQTTATWLAMDSYGLATISVAITDPEGVTGKVSLRILVNIQSINETDTTSPTVVSKTPAANAVGVTPGSTVSVEFSEELLASSVTAGCIAVTGNSTVSGSAALQSDKKTILWTPATSLPGNQTITVSLAPTISDLYGNQIGEIDSWTFTTALIPNVTVNTLYTNDTTPEITGTVDDPEVTLQVTVNSVTYNATLDGTAWKVQLTSALPDGVFDVQAVATNKVGVTGSDASADELTIDTGAKTAILSGLPATTTGSTQTAITVGGTGVVSYLYRHRLSSAAWGDWSAARPVSEKIALTGLADGMQNLQVRAVDIAGNIQTEAEATYYEWTVDTTVKIAQFDAATLPLDPTNQTTTNIKVAGSGVTYYRFRLNSGSWSITYPVTTLINLVGLKSGENTIYAIGGDNYGNWQSVDDPASYTWEVDANVKIAVLDNVPTNPTNVKNAAITVGGEGVTRYKYSIDGGAVWTDEILISDNDTISMSDLADGSYLVKVVGGDDLGTWQATANATTWNWVVDTAAPSADIVSSVAEYTNVPVPASIVFNEPVDFEQEDFTLTNCSISYLRQMDDPGTTWSFDITPAGTGLVTVALAAGAVSDFAGNPTEDEAALTFNYSVENPSPILAPSPIAPTNTAVTITLSFNKVVVGFDISHLTVVNGTVSDLTVVTEDQVWTFLVTPSNEGEVTVDLAAGKVADLYGNLNTVSNHVSFIYDSIEPTVVLSTTSVSPTNDNPIIVTIDFSEEVSAPVLGNIVVTGGGSASNLTLVDAAAYIWSVEIAPPPEGDIAVSFAAGVVADLAGNTNTAASPLSISCDSVQPSVVALTTTDTNNPTSNSPIPVTIEFSEPVNNFQLAHLSITNGSAGNLQAGAVSNSYTFDVTPQTNGVVIISLPENRVMDFAGNYNLAAPFPLSKTYDSVQPTAIMTTTANTSVNAMPIEVTIEFNKDIVDFDLSDLSVSNGTPDSLTNNVPSRKWTFGVTAQAQGDVTVYLAANKVHDGAGNGNKASNQIKVKYDSVSPSVIITSTASESTNLSPIPIRIEFSEMVNGFDIGDLQIDNYTSISSLQTVIANRVWITTVTPATPGNVTVLIAPDSVTDAAGNGNTGDTLIRNYDIDRPGVVISTIKPDPTNANPIPVTITFDEDVSGFNIGHLVVTNGSAGNLVVATTNRAWTADITPSAEGNVTVEIAAGKVTDIAGNTNEASNQLKRYYDATKPTPVISLAQGYTSPVNGTFKVNVTFNDDVDGFTYNDLSVSNGSPQDSVEVVTAGRSWNVTIAPSGNGTYTIGVDLGVDKVTDISGNGNAAATRLNVDFDNKAPKATLSTPEGTTNTSPIPVTITFDEPVTGFALADVNVTNGTAQNFAVVTAGLVWTVDVYPSSNNTTVTIDLYANAVVDAAGNSDAAPDAISVTYNSDRPSANISSTETDPTNNSPIPITVVFGEAVSGFAENELVVGNGSVNAGSLSSADGGITWTANITPSSNGLVTVDVPANVAVDVGDNPNTAAAQFSITYDTDQPGVTLLTTSPNPTNNSSFSVTITFDKDVTDFDLADLTLSPAGVTVTNLETATASRSWTFDVNFNAEVEATVTLEADKVQDAAGNLNTAGDIISISRDVTPPTALLEANVGANTGSKNITVTLSFSESVTGFSLSDLDLNSNCSASNLQPVGSENSTWTFTISAINNGLVELKVPAGVASDTAGNGNGESNALSWNYDSGKPSVTLMFTPALPSRINSSVAISVTASFSETVGGFEVSELVVGNGTASNFIEFEADKVWTADITPDLVGDGLITVNIAADVATDSADNGNTAANQISVFYDNTSPLPTLTSSVGTPTNANSLPVTITFPENVVGFDKSKLQVTNGTVAAGDPVVVTPNLAWRVNIEPLPNQNVTVELLAGAASDTAGNLSLASADTLSWTHDSTKPLPVFSTTSPDPASTTVPMTIDFGEPITGFVLSEVKVSSNAYANGLSGGPQVWTFNLVPLVSQSVGTFTVDLAAGSVQDLAGNANDAAAQFSIDYDKISPTVALSSSVTSPTKDSPIPVVITFSEAVNGLVEGSLVIGNGSVAGGTLTTVDNIIWTVDINPDGDGTVTVNLPAGVASDTAGNGNSAAAQLSRDYDAAPPTVTIATATFGIPDPTNTSPIRFLITFSEKVNGFELGDIDIGNGNAGNFTVVDIDKSWRVDIVPIAVGDVTVDIAANVASDTAGNGNLVATQFSIEYDSDRPTVVFSAVDGGLDGTATNTSPIPFKVTFSKDINGFDLTDISVGNGTAGNLVETVARTEYTFDVTPSTDGLVTVDMAENKVWDDVTPTGNYNTAAAQFSRVYDSLSPSVTLSTTANKTNGTPFEVTLTFYEDVQDADVMSLSTADFEFEGSGQVNSVVASVANRVYTMTVSPLADPVKIKLLADKVRDLVGNYNTESNQITVEYDVASPTVTMSSSAPDPTNVSPIPLTITFSEQVIGFTIDDLQISNATITTGISENSPGLMWSANLVPLGDGPVTVDIGASVASDTAGNGNLATDTFSREYDATQPGVTFTSINSPGTSVSPINFTVTFTETIDVTTFDQTDITVSGGNLDTMTLITAGQVYDFTVIPSGNGNVIVSMAANMVRDPAGNFNLVATQASVVYDTVQPTVTLATNRTITNNTTPFILTVTFSEVMKAFNSGMLTINNCSAAAAVEDPANQGRVWTVSMTAGGDPATVMINAGVVEDLGGNKNAVSNTISVEYDVTKPGFEISPASLVPTNARPIVFTVLSDEFVNGSNDGVNDAFVNAADFEPSVATMIVTNVVQATAGRAWNVSVNFVDPNVVTMDGDIGLVLKAGTLTDLAGNTNNEFVFPTRRFDTIIPEFSSLGGSTAGVYDTNAIITVDITFSEPVVVTGAPRLRLDTQPVRLAGYADGSGNNTLQFTYRVQSGDVHNGTYLDYTSTTALELNGGTIRDEAGNAADRTLPAPGMGSSLAVKEIEVDGTQ